MFNYYTTKKEHPDLFNPDVSFFYFDTEGGVICSGHGGGGGQ
jgi:hypothetical protein